MLENGKDNATKEDHDLAIILHNQENLMNIQRHVFVEKLFFQLIQQNQIEVCGDIVY
jgi:hypothetical protein